MPLPFNVTDTRISVRVWSPDAGIPVRLKVEDHADPTHSVESEAVITTAAAWQTLTFNFAPGSQAAGTAAINLGFNYDKATILFDFGRAKATSMQKTYYFDDVTFVPGAGGGGGGGGGATTALVTFDAAGVTYTLTGFGGAEDSTVVTDPTGGSNKVAKVIKSGTAELWAGTTMSTGASQSIATIAFSATAKTMTLHVYSPAVGVPIRLKVEDAADPTHRVETEAMTTVANAWQTLTFNFANPAPGTAALNLAFTFNKASVFPNFGKTGAAGGGGTYYFDDLSFIP